jgi:glycosyltransferase involved in cell wall biosynthesis
VPGIEPLFCGKLILEKRKLDYLVALGLEHTGQPSTEMHALVVADGPLRHEAEAYTASKGVHATFAGVLDQSRIAKAYVAADCLVLPSSDGETWGLVVNEVMACGRPALASDRVGCHLDLVVPGKTGHVFSLGDVASLASHLSQPALDPTAARALGAGADALVEGRHSIPNAAAGTVRALSALGAGFGTEARAFAC